MGSRTSSLLVAALLVSLLTHRLPFSCARHVAVVKVNHGLNNRGDLDLAKEPASGSADDLVVKKGFEGQKLGAGNMEEAEAMGVKGDKKEKADVSRPKPQGSQTEQQGLAGSASVAAARRRRPASSAAAAGSRPRMVELHTVAGKYADPAAEKYADPAAEMYDMLSRDYRWKASRRRPINNGEPLHDEEP